MTEEKPREKEFLFEHGIQDERYFYMHEMAQKMKHIKKIWMVRNCEAYHSDYVLCNSYKGMFYQLYVNGTFDDCDAKWKQFKDCKSLSNNYDEEAAKRLIEVEEKRIAERLQGHFDNDVWEKRSEPPEDWNKPLPPELAKLSENSLLKEYQENGGSLSLEGKAKTTVNTLATTMPPVPCTIL